MENTLETESTLETQNEVNQVDNTQSDFDQNPGKEYPIQLNTEEFKQILNLILEHNKVDEIVETGSFHGDGSTLVFAQTGKYVYGIECNPEHYVISYNNLINFPNVCLIHGLSLKRETLIKGLLNEKFDIDTNYDSFFPKTSYMREINYQVSLEDALNVFCNNDRHQLIFLDSAGGVGYLEYKEVMSWKPEYLMNKVLILDDITHIKHLRSVLDLIDKGYSVGVSQEKRFAWVSFQETANRNLLLSESLKNMRNER